MLYRKSAKFKKIIRDITPPVIYKKLLELANRKTNQWGNVSSFKTWDEASKLSTGYDSKVILEKVIDSMLMVKNGEAVYERDSVIFDEVQIMD